MLKNNKIYDVIIIGGGASGLMAAAVAGARGKSVLVLDKNKSLGEKLKITGGGRCNITNNEPDIHKLLKVYGPGAPFLYTPFSIFGVKDTFNYFESRGLPLVVQARNRVFPATEKAVDVFNVLHQELIKYKVEVKNNCLVKDLIEQSGRIINVNTNLGQFYAKSFILASGGMSHPETGATGDGFLFLKKIGHNISEPTPEIVPVEVADSWVKMLSGTSLSFMKITFYQGGLPAQGGLKKFSKIGKILFTHFGLSGPLVLNSAKQIKTLLDKGSVEALIDMYPDTTEKALEEKIIKVFDLNKNKILKTIIKEFVPDGLSLAVQELLTFIDLNTKVHSVTKESRLKIVKLLKGMPVMITGLMGYDRAVVVDGGVPLSEIEMKTMQSKICQNLYVTGDLLHINRNSGGYSLQICWTTGYLAGMAI